MQQGDPAPSFSLPDQSGRTVSLSDFLGRTLLVYFYPKADTPGCTTQSCEVRDAREDLTTLGVDVVGISVSPPSKPTRAFDEKFSLGFPLLSDPDHVVCDAWGTWGREDPVREDVHGRDPVVVPRGPRWTDPPTSLVQGLAEGHGSHGAEGAPRATSA